MPPLVRISDISLYLRCPRLVYFDSLGSIPEKINPEHLLLKSLMLSLYPGLDTEVQMRSALSRLEQELPLAYEVNPDELSSACRLLEDALPDISKSFSGHIRLLHPCEVEVDLRSDKLGMSGRLDRLIMKGNLPSLIRTGSAPCEGVWKRDRLVLAGYSLLLADKFGSRADRGLVEYPRSGEIREVQIRGVDRARVLRIRDRIRRIRDGQLPDRPQDARCEKCSLREQCEMRYSLASKFF